MPLGDANSGNQTNLASAFSQAKCRLVSRGMLMKMRFFSSTPSLPAQGEPPPPLLSPLWRSRAHLFLVRLIGMNGPTCAASEPGLGFHGGPAPSATLPVTVGEIDGPGSTSVFEEAALDLVRLSADLPYWQARASAEPLIERLRLTGLCDTSLLIQTGPRTRSPLLPLRRCLETLMKICGHFRAPSLA